MPVVMAVVAALGGLAFWRRRQLGQEAQKLSDSARHAVQEMRSGRKELLVELGEHVYAKSVGDGDPSNEDEISRIIGELAEIDTADESDQEAVEADATV